MPIITECHSPMEAGQSGGPVANQATNKPTQQNGPNSDGNNQANQITSPSNETGVSVSSDCGSQVFTTVGNTMSYPHNATHTFSNYNAGSSFTVPPPTYMICGGMYNNSGSGNAAAYGVPPPNMGKSMPPPGGLHQPSVGLHQLHQHQLLPLPIPPSVYGVNTSASKSSQPNGQDLPINDMATLRFFFNLGVEYMWWWTNGGAAMGASGMAPGILMPAPPMAAPHQNLYVSVPGHQGHPGHRSQDVNNDLSQEMYNLSVMDRCPNSNNSSNQGHAKPGNKNNNSKQDVFHKGSGQNNQQGKGLGQNQNQVLRGAPLGPRFKRGDSMHGNKGNAGNKGNNNARRGSFGGPSSSQSSGGNESYIGCCDEPVIVGGLMPAPQPAPYYAYGLAEEVMVPTQLVDPSAAYLLSSHYVGYGYCPPAGYYAAGPPLGPPPMSGFCPPGTPLGPPLYCPPPPGDAPK